MFQGHTKDFKETDGYFVLNSMFEHIIKLTDGKMKCRITPETKGIWHTGGTIQGGWSRSSNIKIRPAKPQEIAHLDACIEAGKYVDAPEVSEYVYEGLIRGCVIEDGDYHCSIRNYLFRIKAGTVECRIVFGDQLKTGYPEINYEVNLKPATKEQSSLLDNKLPNYDYVGVEKRVNEVLANTSDVVFEGKCCDFPWTLGYYKVTSKGTGRVNLVEVVEDGNISFIKVGLGFFHSSNGWANTQFPVIVEHMNKEEIDWLKRCQKAGALVGEGDFPIPITDATYTTEGSPQSVTTKIATNTPNPNLYCCDPIITTEGPPTYLVYSATEDDLRKAIQELAAKLNKAEEQIFEFNNILSQKKKTLKQRFLSLFSDLV